MTNKFNEMEGGGGGGWGFGNGGWFVVQMIVLWGRFCGNLGGRITMFFKISFCFLFYYGQRIRFCLENGMGRGDFEVEVLGLLCHFC